MGDVYVAATGLPFAQPSHATSLICFAQQCKKRFHEVIAEDLADRLGVECFDLALQIGMSSGPVTAGALRGKTFQLFGDPVQLAAHMQRNGMRDKIQCSEAMANLIKQEGKGHWLALRRDLLSWQNGGAIQSYWVELARVEKEVPVSIAFSVSSTFEEDVTSIGDVSYGEESEQSVLDTSPVVAHKPLRLDVPSTAEEPTSAVGYDARARMRQIEHQVLGIRNTDDL